MALHYHTAPRLGDLFSPLYQHVRSERRELRPQTPQTIVVGNLDTEAWLQQEFLKADAILMSVNFPFLEAAIENLVLRLARNAAPSASESWFTAPVAQAQIFAGMPELETILLRIMAEAQHAKIFSRLGFGVGDLTALQKLALARNLAGVLREHLLHAPRAMQKIRQTKSLGKTQPLAELWRVVSAELTARELVSPLFDPAYAEQLIAAAGSAKTSLYLFGMPLLSAYHVQMLAAIAGFCEVYLFGFAPPPGNAAGGSFTGAVSGRYSRYADALAAECRAHSVAFEHTTQPVTAPAQPLPQIELWGLPGKWRAAEIITDHWHDLLLRDHNLRQEDFAVALSDIEGQLAPFELAGVKRELSIFTRHKVMQKPQPFVELVQIFSEAALGGLSRAQLLEYLGNAAVKRAFGLTPELLQVFTGAFETAHAYRDDYPESQGEFNFDAALRRICRGTLLDGRGELLTGVPGHAVVAELDSPETADLFLRCSSFLLKSARRLAAARGAELATALREIFADGPFAGDEALKPVLQVLSRLARAGEPADLSAPQLTALLREYAPGMALLHSQSSEGISLCPASAASFVRPYQAIFDVNEDIETREVEQAGALPEYTSAATRLTAEEQLNITLTAAMLSGCRELLFCYSLTDPATGADKYPARQIEALRSSLQATGYTLPERRDFSQTILQIEGADDPPLSSTGDAETARRIAHATTKASADLVSLLTPAAVEGDNQRRSLADLERFISNPAVARLAQHGVVPEEPVDFRRDEPGLSVSSGSRLKFCEEYLHSALHLAANAALPDALATIVQKQNSGSAAPDGFDHAKALLMSNDNNRRLAETATAERNNTRIIEYILHEKVTSAFAVQESERLERRYLPAPVIADFTITGRSAPLLQRSGSPNLVLLDTSVGDYPKRTTLLVRAYLLLAVMLQAARRSDLPPAIEIGKYEIGKAAAERGILQQEYKTAATLATSALQNPEAYLHDLILATQQATLFWFDLGALPQKKKLAVFAETPDAEIITLLADSEAGGFDGTRNEFIRRFYDLQAGQDSADFFNRFVRPIAIIDQLSEGTETKKRKKGG